MSQNIGDFEDNNPKFAEVLKYANDVMHRELKDNHSIVVVAIHNRDDPRKFTIVADSEYDTALEGVVLTFDNPEDFKTIFPQFATPPPPVLGPNMELDSKTNKAIPIHKDPYPIHAVFSLPAPANPDENAPENVLNKDSRLTWAVNKNPATLLIDLGQDSEIGTVWVAWSAGDKRQYKFTVAVALDEQITTENKTFTVVDHLVDVYSSGTTAELEAYRLVTDTDMAVKARYIMLKVYGNTEDNWATISQVQVTKAVALKSAEQKQDNHK